MWRATMRVGGETIYDVVYHFDADALRVTPAFAAGADCALFFGGSFTFGEADRFSDIDCDEESLAVRAYGVVEPKSNSEYAADPRWKERDRGGGHQGIPIGAQLNRHEGSVGSDIEDLLAIRPPSGVGATAYRDLTLATTKGERFNVDFIAPRLIGGI